MMLPRVPVELLEELAAELPLRSAIELSMNEEMIDCADSALVDGVASAAAAAELEVLPVRALIRF